LLIIALFPGEGFLVIFPDGKVPQRQAEEAKALFVGVDASEPFDLDLYMNVPNFTKDAYERLPQIFPFQKRRYLFNLMASSGTPELQRIFSSALSKSIHVDFKCKSGSNAVLGFCEGSGKGVIL
jgi:hypothetical protein